MRVLDREMMIAMKVHRRFGLFVACLLVASACLSAQDCKKLVFDGTVKSQETYTHRLSSNLLFRLTPLKDNWGWLVSVAPKDSDEDWTAPVTFPIRTQEAQLMGTGYGSSVQERLAGPTMVFFVLSQADFIRYSRMSQELWTLRGQRLPVNKSPG